MKAAHVIVTPSRWLNHPERHPSRWTWTCWACADLPGAERAERDRAMSDAMAHKRQKHGAQGVVLTPLSEVTRESRVAIVGDCCNCAHVVRSDIMVEEVSGELTSS